MKWSSPTLLLFILVAVLITLQFKSCFDKVNKPEQMIRNEERLKYLEKERLADSVVIVEKVRKYDSLIALSMEKSNQLATKYQTVKTIYEKIPVIVNDFDREQLRRAIAEY